MNKKPVSLKEKKHNNSKKTVGVDVEIDSLKWVSEQICHNLKNKLKKQKR